MVDIVTLIGETEAPLMAGNRVFPVKACVAALKAALPMEKRFLYGRLREMLSGSASMTAAELGIMRDVIGRIPADGDLSQEKQALCDQLAAINPISPVSGAGRANILFVGEQPFNGQPFGAVHTLEVNVQPWGGDIRLLNEAAKDTLYGGFHPGCRAAIDFACSHWDRIFQLYDYLIVGNFPSLRAPVKGESLGLGAAVAILSRLMDIPIPSSVAFTGRIDIHGNLLRVEGITTKLEAARDKGIKKVYLPDDNSRDITAAIRNELQLHPANTLQEVVESLFNRMVIDSGLERLEKISTWRKVSQRSWRVGQPVSPDAKRVLLTIVGKSDPIGTWKDKQGEPISKQEGPILTVCREVRPNVVYFFYTTTGENDLTTNMNGVMDFLQSEDPSQSMKPVPIPLPAVSDPTNLSQLIPAFRAAFCEIVKTHPPESHEYFVNFSSGTGQMMLTWYLLTERLLPAQLLQIREGRYVQEGESRVRSVVIPVV